jgi:hypothetical protein
MKVRRGQCRCAAASLTLRATDEQFFIDELPVLFPYPKVSLVQARARSQL